MNSNIIHRHAIRAILLTPEKEVLLIRIRHPERKDWFWICPGGGMETGETPETALQRELQEELGLQLFEIGPLVWRRQHTFNWNGKRICQLEQYHVVDVPRFEPMMSDAQEMMTLDRFHWWPVVELARANEPLVPLSLAEIILRYLENGPPAAPLDVEILVD